MNQFKAKSVLCPVCSTGREIPAMRVPYLRLVLTGSLCSAAIFGGLGILLGVVTGGWGALVGFTLYYIVGEAIYQHRYKKELVCPVCRFDPILYRRSPERAKQRCLDSLKMREDTFLSKWQALKQTASDSY